MTIKIQMVGEVPHYSSWLLLLKVRMIGCQLKHGLGQSYCCIRKAVVVNFVVKMVTIFVRCSGGERSTLGFLVFGNWQKNLLSQPLLLQLNKYSVL